MDEKQFYSQLKSESTWKLFGLSVITLGIYLAYYIKKKSQKINNFLESDQRISDNFASGMVYISYISVMTLIFYFVAAYLMIFSLDGETYYSETNSIGATITLAFIRLISDLIGMIFNILVIVWAFKMRNRINSLNQYNPSDKKWFHGFWTFLFSTLYINFKINKIHTAIQLENKNL